jgi:hypothetical protein
VAAVTAAVRPELGPTLPEIVPVRWRRTAAVVGGLVVLAIAVQVLRPADDGIDVVRTGPVAFNFRYTADLPRVKPRAGELLRLERTAGGKFIQSFVVRPLTLPAYRGDVVGILPVLAAHEIDALRARYASFELVEEGKARVNDAPGYQVVFRARLAQRRLYGRLILLPEFLDGKPVTPRRGVELLLEATPSAGVGRAEDVGARGLNKRPFRTFRFGTEKP